MKLKVEHALRVAGFELNALNFSSVLPVSLDGVRIENTGTIIHDITGEPLFMRIPLETRRGLVAVADIAVNDIFAEPLLAIQMGGVWNETVMLRRADLALRKSNREAKYDEARFVAYSYPKLAVQFLLEGREVAMLELFSWHEVPAIRKRDRGEAPSNFERWSLLEETSEKDRESNADSFKKRIGLWSSEDLVKIDSTLVSRATLDLAHAVIKLSDTHEVHYGPRTADHHICYELRGQQTSVWCVAASVEMILNFYRWRYNQPVIADELDLGTCDYPNGLPYGQEIKVVNTLEKLSSNTLDAAMIATPDWAVHRDEIRADRPLISFVPGHSRTIAGYTESFIAIIGELPYRGLLVYDPWPPTDCDHPEDGGVITRWENFRTTTYRFAFTSELQHV